MNEAEVWEWGAWCRAAGEWQDQELSLSLSEDKPSLLPAHGIASSFFSCPKLRLKDLISPDWDTVATCKLRSSVDMTIVPVL